MGAHLIRNPKTCDCASDKADPIKNVKKTPEPVSDSDEHYFYLPFEKILK